MEVKGSKDYDVLVDVAVVGEASVGKTSLISREFKQNPQDHYAKLTNTAYNAFLSSGCQVKFVVMLQY